MTNSDRIWIPRTSAVPLSPDKFTSNPVAPLSDDESTTISHLTSPTHSTSSTQTTRLSDMSTITRWCEKHRTFASAQPAIQVYNISIFNKSFIRNPQDNCQVYGIIRVVDNKDGKQCTLYNRHVGDDNLDVISFHRTGLTLTGPEVPISMKEPEIFVDIRDKANAASIFQGSGSLHNATSDEFEKVQCLTLPLEGGVVEVDVEYIALMFGTAAVLEITPMEVCEDESEEDSGSNEESIAIFGSISASYNIAYLKPSTNLYSVGKPKDDHSMREIFCTKLFEKPPNDPQVVKLESPMNLSRRVVVMPAYSSLVIDFDLKDRATNQPIINGKLFVNTREFWFNRADITSESNQNLKMHASVHLKLPFVLDEASYDKSSITDWDFDRLPNGMLVNAFSLVEIFSVIIGRPNDEELRLYGTVIVNELGCNIFTATKENPYVLRSGCKRLPLNCPSHTMSLGDHLSISVKLMDVEQRIYINGYVSASVGLRHSHKSWYDRRLCAVIKGAFENGFAAVNYMVMPSSIKAVVKVNFLSKGTTEKCIGCLYGKIVAFYSKYEYETDEDREYYRCVLFDGSIGSCLTQHGHNSQVKLSRSVVPVPLDSSLRVGVDLKLRSIRGVVDHVHDIAEFQPGGIDPSVHINGGGFVIRV